MTSGLELFERVRRHAHRAPGQSAYVEVASGQSITYAELVERVESFTDAPPAGAVTLRSANRIEFAVQYFALLTRGRTVFPISIELAEVEVANLQRQTTELL